MSEEQRMEDLEETAREDAPEAEAPQETDPAKLREALAAADAKAEEYLAAAQRARADYENLRKRTATASADSFGEGRRSVAADMLGVLDNLERALASAGEDSPLKNGVELTLRQMLQTYEKLGVKEIDCLGQKFDPNLENAVMTGAPEDGEPGTVCMVLQKGYRMGDRILREAMVKVVPD